MTTPLRRTKIVCTLGPATDQEETLEKLLLAGANIVRLNFSHGSAADHIRRAQQVRALAQKHGLHIAIMGDLQGPKIRVSTFAEGKVLLHVDALFTLDAALPAGKGDNTTVGIDYKKLPGDVRPDDILLLDDGRIHLQVLSVREEKIITKVRIGGQISNNKGINKLGGGLSAEALTEKDKQDIHTAAAIGVDYLALSFPRCGEDVHYARRLAVESGCPARIVAKIERAEAVASQAVMDEIILASDVIMVARGDLGVEIGEAELVGVQKLLIRRACKLDRGVITATQMMESMISNPMPTRAEVMDVANAVLDGTDAVMLSAESASGKYPVQTVAAMAQICLGAEKMPALHVSRHRLERRFEAVEDMIAMSAMYAANLLDNVVAIVTLTESGRTPLLMSRISSALPIFGLSRHEGTLNRMALYKGVKPVGFNSKQDGLAAAMEAIMLLETQNFLQKGALVIITQGDQMGTVGSSNTCRILSVP